MGDANMIKKYCFLILSLLIFSSCNLFDDKNNTSNYTNVNNTISSNYGRKELEGINISSSKSEILTGESITLTATYYPEDAKYFNNKQYSSTYFEWYYTLNDSTASIRIDKNGGEVISFTAYETGNYIIWAKYCNHSFHSNGVGDLISNKISIFVDLPELEKVYYKYSVLEDGTAAIIPGSLLQNETEIEIPSTIDGYNVSIIPNLAFKNMKNLISVKIPYGVKSIGYDAFLGCSNLKYVVIPGSVTSIGKDAFNNCNSELYGFFETANVSSISGFTEYAYQSGFNFGFKKYFCEMKDFAINEEILYGLKKDNTYSLIKALTRKDAIYLPDEINGIKITSVASEAFKDDTYLELIYLDEYVTTIQSYAFSGCINATIILCNKVTNIEEYAFYNTKSVDFDYSLSIEINNIGSYAFAYCKYVYFPEGSIKHIGSYAFKNCEYANFECDIENKASNAFDNCQYLSFKDN